ncbi:MAG: acyl-CoA desaturase [Vicinamibacterales bacterium]
MAETAVEFNESQFAGQQVKRGFPPLTWKSSPMILVHVAALLVFFVPFSWSAVAVCAATYFIRVFGITGGYHRYFSHRTYKTSRVFQFVLAWIGTSAVQKGVLWWSAHHRHHHRFSDLPGDLHSPGLSGFVWAHIGWILATDYERTEIERVPDLAKYPELVWINNWHLVPPIALAVGLFLAGGWSWLVWGFFFSTVLCWHATFVINSLTHMFGRRRYATKDDSRNSLLLALITMGEGWHNNHHYYQSSTRQGFFWWEIDLSYYVLRMLSVVGIVWDIREPPAHVVAGNLRQAA